VVNSFLCVLCGKLARIGIQENVIVHPALRWLAVMLWMGVIFTLSAIPSLSSPFEPLYDVILRKFAHMAEYGILTALLFWALRLHLPCRAHGLLMAAVIALLFAFSDEWHQSFVPGREGSLRDVGIDALGVIGLSLWFARSE
jgi:VanZ family protein